MADKKRKKRHTTKIALAAKSIERMLDSLPSIKKAGATCEILLWEPGPWGIRIAEVSFVAKDGLSGFSYMRCDPSCAAIILYCEELMVETDKLERQRLQETVCRLVEVG